MFDDFISIVSENEFRERPVELDEFMSSPDYMDMASISLSPLQRTVVNKSTEIYRPDTLRYLYGESEGSRRAAAKVKEVVCQIGKGGGKNFISTISVSYIIYKLLCLKDPHSYYGKPRDDSIDLLNVAINAPQASNNFFNPLVRRIKHSPWFSQHLVDDRRSDVVFEHNVHAYSGHSEKEGWEGYNLLAVILDEIAGFATQGRESDPSSKTAESIYKMYRASVTSRYPDDGKLILLSFPRHRGDFITTRYDSVVASKDVRQHREVLYRNPDMSKDAPGNAYELTWTEDKVLAYNEPRVFAVKAPSFVFNPERVLQDYVGDIFYDPVDALRRYFCMPPEADNAFFRYTAPLHEQFGERAPPGPFQHDTWQLASWFKPDASSDYYVHVDIGYKFDRAAVAVAHVDKWVTQQNYGSSEPVPMVVVDVVRYWTPSTERNVNLQSIKQFILQLRAVGFNLSKVTFDQFQSVQMIQELNNMGISAERLSVQRQHYGEFASALYAGRVLGYRDEVLLDELLGIQLLPNNKVDHKTKGSNDAADAVVGAVYNAINESGSPATEVEVFEVDDYLPKRPPKPQPEPRPPKPQPELADIFDRMEII